jgi:hypothetical protein
MSASQTALVDTAVSIPFPVFDVDGITPLTGLVNGDFAKTVFRDGTDETGSITVTVSEIGSTGTYVAVFIPDARGLWLVTASYDEAVYGCYIDVGLFDTVETLRKETSNRNEIDFSAQEEVAYDDDGTTIVQRWPLETDGGESVTTQLGVQTKRKPPILPRT